MTIHMGAYARTSPVENKFETIREVVAQSAKDGRRGLNLVERMTQVSLSCQKGQDLFSADRCLTCQRFVNCLPSGDKLTIRCLWRECDPVSLVMTRTSALVTVSPTLRVSVAESIAREHDLRHLLVVDRGRLVGVICRCDLAIAAKPNETIGDRVNHCPWVIEASAGLAHAAAVMADKQIGCLPVVRDRILCGVVTRGDLRRVGIEERFFGESRCLSRELGVTAA